MSHIPSELIDEIIDRINADIYSLMTCSTVSKAWLPRSRHHIFGRLCLQPSTSAKFFELVDSPLSTIAPYVRHLVLTRTYGGGGQLWFPGVLPRLITFTALLSCTLTLANFVPFKGDLTPIFASSFRLLSHLALSRCRFKSFAQFTDVMCACPNLESFASTDLSWNADDAFSDPKHIRLSRHPLLRALNLCGDGKGAVLNWLRLGASPPRVSRLVITWLYLEDPECFGAFLRALGPSLVDLEMTVHSENSIPSRPVRYDALHPRLIRINRTTLP